MADLKFYDREDRRWPNARLERSAIIGHTTTASTRIWVRTRDEGLYWLMVNADPFAEQTSKPQVTMDDAGNRMLSVDGAPVPGLLQFKRTTNDTDRTCVFDVTSLTPGTRYFYAVVREIDLGGGDKDWDWEIGKDANLSFVTQKDGADEVTFGLYSCHMPYNLTNIANMDMWSLFDETLDDVRADFIIGGGDQVYSDGNPEVSIWKWLSKNKKQMAAMDEAERHETMVSWYRDIYRGYWGPLVLRKVLRQYPTYMIWDDHEIMDGWGSYTDSELSNKLDTLWEWENKEENLMLSRAMFEAAKQVYREYQHCHNPDTAVGRYEYTFTWGPCAYYVMDMRGQRNFNRNENRILGDEQLAHFLAWMDSEEVANASMIFIVSPVPVVHADKYVVNSMDLNILGLADDLRDEWEHETNWTERDRMLEKVFEFSHTTKKRVAFLSGDVHIGAAMKMTQPKRSDARVYQLTSSAITYYLSDFKRNALELIVRKQGELGYPKATPSNERVSFKLIHTFKHNNFGIVRVKDTGDDPTVTWDLYGNTEVPGQSLREKRVTLD